MTARRSSFPAAATSCSSATTPRTSCPMGIDLGIAPELLDLHIAIDIGAEPLTRALAERLDAPAVLATVSRLVIDLHREPEHVRADPDRQATGIAIPGNVHRRSRRPHHAAFPCALPRCAFAALIASGPAQAARIDPQLHAGACEAAGAGAAVAGRHPLQSTTIAPRQRIAIGLLPREGRHRRQRTLFGQSCSTRRSTATAKRAGFPISRSRCATI